MFHIRKSNYSFLTGKRIGVFGLGPRNGTTHIAVSLCNYLSDICRQKACLIEYNHNNDLEELCLYLGMKEGSNEFIHHRVTYFPRALGNQSDSRLTSNFDCTVFDLGCDISSAYKMLELCDIRIVVGTDAPWHENEYNILNELFTETDNLSSWKLIINLGSTKNKHCYTGYGLSVFCFPLEQNPISPGEQTNKTFERMLY